MDIWITLRWCTRVYISETIKVQGEQNQMLHGQRLPKCMCVISVFEMWRAYLLPSMSYTQWTGA